MSGRQPVVERDSKTVGQELQRHRRGMELQLWHIVTAKEERGRDCGFDHAPRRAVCPTNFVEPMVVAPRERNIGRGSRNVSSGESSGTVHEPKCDARTGRGHEQTARPRDPNKSGVEDLA